MSPLIVNFLLGCGLHFSAGQTSQAFKVADPLIAWEVQLVSYGRLQGIEIDFQLVCLIQDQPTKGSNMMYVLGQGVTIFDEWG